MKKGIWLLGVFCVAMAVLLTGCETGQDAGSRGEQIEFTVVEPDNVPKELQEIIEENKQDEIKLSYEDGGYTYAVRGYGQQKTGGYSIAVNEVYQSGDGIHVDTSLIGPPQDKNMQEEASYPYIVLKMEAQNQDVVFD